MISTEPAVDTWQTCIAEPTCAASRQSRAMIASSATAGHPARPSFADMTPSLSCAPAVSLGSWACWATTPSNAFTYSRARRIRVASDTHCPSSEKTRTLAAESAIAPSSASWLPRRPAVTAPTGRTSQCPAWRPSLQTCSTTPAVSATGSVLAIACTAVYPPRAAAAVPLATVSASSLPGSRRCVCRSTRPGRAIRWPASSTVSWPPGSRSRPSSVTATILPPSIRMSAGGPPSGLAPLISQRPCSRRAPDRAPVSWPPERSRSAYCVAGSQRSRAAAHQSLEVAQAQRPGVRGPLRLLIARAAAEDLDEPCQVEAGLANHRGFVLRLGRAQFEAQPEGAILGQARGADGYVVQAPGFRRGRRQVRNRPLPFAQLRD